MASPPFVVHKQRAEYVATGNLHAHDPYHICCVRQKPELGGSGASAFKDMEKDEPMICSNIASISHVIPLRPWLHLIFSDVPDALAPDYVFKP